MQKDELDGAVGRGDVIDRGDAAIGILERRGKAEQTRDAGTVERKAGGGDRSRTHGREIEQRARLREPLMVAQQHLDRGRQIVPESGRLGRLTVSVGDDQRRLLAVGERYGGVDQCAQLVREPVDAFLQRQLEQGVVDVVARAAGVQAAGVVRTRGACAALPRSGRRNPRLRPYKSASRDRRRCRSRLALERSCRPLRGAGCRSPPA